MTISMTLPAGFSVVTSIAELANDESTGLTESGEDETEEESPETKSEAAAELCPAVLVSLEIGPVESGGTDVPDDVFPELADFETDADEVSGLPALS